MTDSPKLPNDFLSRISDPVAAVQTFGAAIANSGMFGCTRQEQGIVLGLSMFMENKSPLQLRREFHFIGGKLVDRADSILAKFRQAGGRHTVVEKSPNRAAVKLQSDGHNLEFSLTWAEIEKETWVREKDGVTLKTNYATPRGRQKMLWWRCVADAVATVMPEVVAGLPPEEELADDTPPAAALVLPAPSRPSAPPATAIPAPPTTAPPQAPTPPAPIQTPATSAPAPIPDPTPPPASTGAHVFPPAGFLAQADPVNGWLTPETVKTIADLLGPKTEDAKRFAVLKKWLTEAQAAQPGWIALIGRKHAQSIIRLPEQFLAAIKPGEALP